MLYAAEVLERQKVEKGLMRNYPIGFLKYYIEMVKSMPVIRTAGFSVLMYYLAIWPVKFFIYLKMKKVILLPFSIKK